MSKYKKTFSITISDICYLWGEYNYSWVINCSCYSSNGPLTRYTQLRVAHAPGMPGTFPCHRGLPIPTCITVRAVRTCRDACQDRVAFEVGDGEKVPAIPRVSATRNFAYLYTLLCEIPGSLEQKQRSFPAKLASPWIASHWNILLFLLSQTAMAPEDVVSVEAGKFDTVQFHSMQPCMGAIPGELTFAKDTSAPSSLWVYKPNGIPRCSASVILWNNWSNADHYYKCLTYSI